ncbi:MAG: branched-chain amino acid ABC transporter permease [Ornithinimicrobium sp.]|uniref:branched-chain amino acid ABC transporter permease n=1 Tax=Ornithinimicrobium sp. TaxID=1977084 RepID=UPI0026DFF49E|nr:branched-chain amino acid ABC transporter permease [Ornithinimicrobium sp.]MDO5738761.1 branched-chain amino acid ABC transporter permease [Ornithinimicrobium sp.]
MKRSPLHLVLVVVGLLAALTLPWVVYPPIAMDIACWALFGVALDVLLGYAGLLSFGHAAFWGSSAYVTGLVAIELGMPFPVAALAGAVFAMLLALPFGLLSVRSSGIYFAMVTLAFAQMVFFVVNQWRGLTGGENGLQGVPRNFFGVAVVESDAFYFYYAALPMILLGIWIAWRVVHSPFGRVLVATRDNPARARALGYDVERYRVMAFVISAGLAGLAGGLFALSHGFVSLQEVAWQTSGKVVLITVLGGIATLWGSIIGAAIIVLMEDALASSGFDGIGIITGSVFIIVVLLFRRGVWGTLVDFVARRRGHKVVEEPIGAADGEEVSL